ncbi:acyltransferase ChoActase/COT/CPT [Tricholoma matsutake]|nr:acyltransferase ChoActase/COT/CPT [Tricholoma matsutake 945]
MDSYKWLFHASRYPALPSDTAHRFPLTDSTNHLIVLRKNRFYIVPLSSQPSAAQLQIQFQRIISHAGPKPHPTPLGALTSTNRDAWASAREALLAAHPSNADLLRKIESAMIILCLDDTAPITRQDVSWCTWVGDGRNRWFDKHQLIVYENGRSGFLGEHSCMDGTPTLRMNEFVLGSLALHKADLGPPLSDSTPVDLPHPEELVFTTNEHVRTLVRSAEAKFDALVADHELHVLHYEAYGSNYIKTHKVSPDAWAQLIKQLSFFKMHARLGVTYESAQTRRFKNGRTEVVRSLSSEAAEWVKAMINPSAHKDPTHLRSLFLAAVKRHMTYSSWAANGQGIDRHLFGLKKSLKSDEEVPGLYKDEAYAKSSHWEMSTSQLSSPLFDGWGYGEVVENGYGLAYALGSNYMRWTVTSRKNMRPAEMGHYLAEAATEVRDMMEAAREADSLQKEKGEAKL